MNFLSPVALLAAAGAVPGHDEAVKLWMSIPFILLLVLIAAAPLSSGKLKEIWSRHYPAIAIGLGVFTALYYVCFVPGGFADVWHSIKEYISFIALVGSLFVISGGISITLDGEATPKTNVIFLLIGAALANLIGTTGASMVLIRPWIKMNSYRLSVFHIVFFIFIVSNAGGALTPIGDPPLYIGYLRGVSFFWVFEHANFPWIFVIGMLLLVFYFFDAYSFRRAGPRGDEFDGRGNDDAAAGTTLTIRGMRNLGYLFVVVCAVLLPGQVSPAARSVMETYFIREIVMIVAAVLSYVQTHPKIHRDNDFTFEPIREVGFLFIGIFLTMVPALAYLISHGHEIGSALTRPAQYFFVSGLLSGFLDNTPTYANFFDLIRSLVPEGVPADEQVAWMTNPENHEYNVLVVAISLGSVFFGALTYIGNGPNFMVKSIAENAKVQMPTFFGYILRYSLPILIPILLLCSLLFFSVAHGFNFDEEEAADDAAVTKVAPAEKAVPATNEPTETTDEPSSESAETTDANEKGDAATGTSDAETKEISETATDEPSSAETPNSAKTTNSAETTDEPKTETATETPDEPKTETTDESEPSAEPSEAVSETETNATDAPVASATPEPATESTEPATETSESSAPATEISKSAAPATESTAPATESTGASDADENSDAPGAPDASETAGTPPKPPAPPAAAASPETSGTTSAPPAPPERSETPSGTPPAPPPETPDANAAEEKSEASGAPAASEVAGTSPILPPKTTDATDAEPNGD